ncbi:MAG: T9SS type A sorting domain-containing protein [bacterium]
MKKYLPTLGLVLLCIGLNSQNAWINEIHYDDAGSDSSEVVEIVIENPGNYTLSLFQVFLYNGNGGTIYDNESVNNFTEGNSSGNFIVYYWEPSSIQNGAPDGLALAYDNALIDGQFLSYEGEFSASEGPASGITSTDIFVLESGEPEGFSLQLTGSGSQYSDFTWLDPDSATVGELNNNQTLTTNSNSALSDIIKTPGWNEAVDIDYTIYFDSIGLTTTNALELASFTIRDGGEAGADNDELMTSLTSVTFSVLNAENILTLALFDGTENLLEVSPVDSVVLFSDFSSISATDDGSKDFSLYGTFRSVVNDNENLKFTILDADADPAGSTFAASDAGGAETDDSGSNNQLIVTADRLAIHTPLSVFTDEDFLLEVEATDNQGSRDLDENSDVLLTLGYGSGMLSSSTGLDQQLSEGYFLWTDVQYDETGAFGIEAQSAELLNGLSDTITASESPTNGLMISLLCDPQEQYATDRFIQIYNGYEEIIDLSGWMVVAVGNNTDIFTWELSGNLMPGETKNCGDDENTRFFPDFAATDWSSSNSNWNGGSGDGARLQYGDVVIDEASSHGDFANGVSIRNPDITGPSSGFQASEWTTSPVNFADEDPASPGVHYCQAPHFFINGSGNWSDLTADIGNGSSFTFSGIVTVNNDITSYAECYNLNLTAEAQLIIDPGKGLTVNGDLIVAEGPGKASVNPVVIVKSDSSGNGSLIIRKQTPGQDIAFQRHMPGYTGDEDGWHLISSPVDTMDIAASDFEPGEWDDLFCWSESSNVWDNYKDEGWEQPRFTAGQGYLAAYENTDTKTFSGVITHTDVVFTDLSLTTGQGEGWHLLGNPFTSAIVWDTDEWQLENVETAAHTWNDLAGNYLLVTNGDPIPSTCGFFIKVSDPGNSIFIPLSARKHSVINNYKLPERDSLSNYLNIEVTINQSGHYDINHIGFRPDASSEFDLSYDVHKLFGSESAPQLWTQIGEECFARNYFHSLTDSHEIVLFFRAGGNTLHTLRFSGIESFDPNVSIYFEDLFTGEIFDLKEKQEYIFDASLSDESERFRIHLSVLTTQFDPWDEEEIKLYADNGSIWLKQDNNNQHPVGIGIFDLNGRLIYSAQFQGGQVIRFQPEVVTGIYIVRLSMNFRTIHKKLFINQSNY